MRDEDHGAFEILQRVHQHFLGCEIQVIGRLVQHQKIRRIVKHPRHRQARFLTARKARIFLSTSSPEN